MGHGWIVIIFLMTLWMDNHHMINFENKPLTTQLTTDWLASALILETSEFIIKHQPLNYWKFINECSDKFDTLKLCHIDEYNQIMDITSNYFSMETALLFNLTLIRHDLAPRIHLYQKILENYRVNSDCKDIIFVNNHVHCSLDTLITLEKTLIMDNPKYNEVFGIIFKNYPLFKNNTNKNNTIIYYFGHIGTKRFWSIYNKLVHMVQSNTHLDLIIIPYTQIKCSMNVGLSNYGMSLSIKKDKYNLQNDTLIDLIQYKDNSILSKWLDIGMNSNTNMDIDPSFNIDRLIKLYPEYSAELIKLNKQIYNESDTIKKPDSKEIHDLSLSFLSKLPKIKTIDELNTILSNFPSYAKLLSQEQINKSFKKLANEYLTYITNSHISNGVYLNGQILESLTDNKFDQLISNEITTAFLLSKYIDNTYLNKLNPKEWYQFLESYSKDIYESRRFNIKSSTVTWLNNLEKDSVYSYWPSHLFYLFQLSFTGQLPSVALNAYNFVAVINPMDSSDTANILETMLQLLDARLSVRFGVILNINKSCKLSKIISSGFYFLAIKTPKQATKFLLEILKSKSQWDIQLIKNIFKKYSKLDIINIHENSDPVNDRTSEIRMDIRDLGLFNCDSSFFLNGKKIELLQGNENTGRAIINYVFKELMNLYQKFVNRKFSNLKEILAYNENYVDRMNIRLINSPNFVDNVKPLTNETFMLELLRSIQNRTVIFNADYTQYNSNSYGGNILLFINLNSVTGRSLLEIILGHRSKIVYGSRYTFVFSSNSNQAPLLKRIVELIDQKPLESLKNLIDEIAVLFDRYPVEKCPNKNPSCIDIDIDRRFYHYFDINPNDNAIIWFNKIYMLDNIRDFVDDDVELILEISKVPKTFITTTIDVNTLMPSAYRDTFPIWFGVIIGTYSNVRRHLVTHFEVINNHPEFVKSFDIKESFQRYFHDSLAPHMVAILDPLTENSQKVISQLTSLYNVFAFKITFIMIPTLDLESLPIETYFQWCQPSSLSFDNNTGYMISPSISFKNLPVDPLYTSYMHISSSWMIQNDYGNCDMDNIYLKITREGCYALYQLKHILIEGSSWFEKFTTPSSGIQYSLQDINRHQYSDTLVMNNLGYFQLKSTIGLYRITLKSSQANKYNIKQIKTDSSIIKFVIVDNFEGINLEIMVDKNGHVVSNNSEANIDDYSNNQKHNDDEPNESFWNKISNWFHHDHISHKNTSSDDTINVFSVATGSVYERFIRVMMLSVVKHTRKPVKFWLLRNYLSANFIESLKIMANKYQFDYELVQYQWPKWLNDQKDKRRIIWGYKILFLDSLFPLDVKRIIFVDADQVVRADLDILNKMNLGSAPYAYTPFCNDRHGIDQLRFWLGGYWKNLLRGKPYHISALYVVDLVKFRKMAVGDRLRAHYQSLSEDPNSLSNLDQDLPNSMIHEIPIKSLPQEWLWCETWCSDSSKKFAKSIDLCGNPMTNEPKWKSALRIIPEFAGYDNEIVNLLHHQYPVINTTDINNEIRLEL